MEKNSAYFHASSYRETGLSHIQRNKPCEDSVRSGVHHGIAAAVLSDGAGSCSHAADGSRIVVDTAFTLITEQFDTLYAMTEKEFAAFLLHAVREKLSEASELLQCSYDSLSATMLCVALSEDGRYFYFHVGDGVISACNAKGECRVLSCYVHRIAANVTTFVNVPNTEYHYGKGKNDFCAFFLMSDGPEEFLLLNQDSLTARGELALHISFFYHNDILLQELRELTSMLKESQMYDDASYALLADKRYAGSVSRYLPEYLHEILFGQPAFQKKKKAQISGMFRFLAENSDVPEKQLTKLLRKHKNRYTRSALQPFVDSGVIRYHQKHYFFD